MAKPVITCVWYHVTSGLWAGSDLTHACRGKPPRGKVTDRDQPMPTVHVIPIRDQIEHLVPGGIGDQNRDPSAKWLSIEEDPRADGLDCPCGPAIERVGRTSWLITHHSLDGRERHENPPGRFVRLNLRDLPDHHC